MTDIDPGLFRKITEVVIEVEGVAKAGHNDFQNYDYTTAEDVLRAIRTPLAAKGVALMPSLSSIQEREYTTSGNKASVITTVHVDFTFADSETGQLFQCSWAGQGDDPADKGLGKAYTNCIKTFLRETFLLPQGDDPEADTRTDARAADRSSRPSSRRGSSGAIKPSDKQKNTIKNLSGQKGVNIAQLGQMVGEITLIEDVEINEGWVDRYLTGGRDGSASALIDRLMKGPIPAAPVTEVPPELDNTAPVHDPQPDGDDLPWEPQAA